MELKELALEKLRNAYIEIDDLRHNDDYSSDTIQNDVDDNICDALDSIYEAIKKLGGDL